MERETFNLWTDVYRRDLDGPLDFRNFEPALLYFKDWGVERRLSPVSIRHVEALRAEIEALEKALPEQYPFVMGVNDKEAEEITDLGVHLRGSPHNLGDPVPRHFPAVLCEDAPTPFTNGAGRLELAEAIASHPLAARVIVNRVWRWHFGTGIVDTPSNFGRLGERPSHPELLDYLAGWFLDNGQSIKALHKKILMTSTYQLSSDYSAKNFDTDPANRLHWRTNRRRLDAESIRDSILFVSGALDTKLGGASLDLPDKKNLRRTVYSRVSRFRLHEYLQTFDFPNPNITAETRFTTNVPLQSLFFMNSEFVESNAERLVYRLFGQEPPEDKSADGEADGENGHDGEVEATWLEGASKEEKIREAYQLLYGRDASSEEVEAGADFLDKIEEGEGLKVWTRYARVLLSANEFRFIE